jgi:hypothetical protein
MVSKLVHETEFSLEEVARRRDVVVRRMANTPPQPKSKIPVHHQKRRKKAVLDRAVRKGRVRREPST